MSSYIHGGISDTLSLEDIAKSIGKWASDGFKKSKKSEILDEVKSLFFDLGYIWRGANLYRFETPVEKGLIYAKSKIEGVKAILQKEESNLGIHLSAQSSRTFSMSNPIGSIVMPFLMLSVDLTIISIRISSQVKGSGDSKTE
jgi:hypothetical protein